MSTQDVIEAASLAIEKAAAKFGLTVAWELRDSMAKAALEAGGIDHLRAEVAELVKLLIYARDQLQDYELDATGEGYNDPKINAAINRNANETEGK